MTGHLMFFCVVFLHGVANISGVLNVTRLMNIYISACGTEGTCYNWTKNRTTVNNPITSRCPSCSCQNDCFIKLNCCPDKFFLEKKLRRLRFPFYDDKQSKSDSFDTFPKYSIVDYCPELSNDIASFSCQKPLEGVKNRNFVTSLASNYTYFNFHCALCHGENENDLIEWDIVPYRIDHVLNFIESVEELLQIVNYFDSFLLFHPPKSLKNVNYKFISGKTLLENDCLGDKDLALACSSSYVNEYRLFKNVFCFMCDVWNRKESDTAISSCTSQDGDTQRSCVSGPSSYITYPYRNYDCFLCNIPAPFVSSIRPNDTDMDGTRYTFFDMSTLVHEDSNGIITFRNNIFNDLLLLQTIYNVSWNKREFPHKGLPNMQFSRLLNKMAAVYPHRICNQSVLPNVVQNLITMNCDCSLSCLFTNPCRCCIDTILLHSVECISFARTPFSPSTFTNVELKFQVVGSCFEDFNENADLQEEENVMYLCESGDLVHFDLPVKSRNITYKNVFCFLCNTNFTIENNSLTTDPYEILDLRIHCKQQLHFGFSINFSQVIDEALEIRCDILYDIDDLVICTEHYSQTDLILTCDVSRDQTDVDLAEIWACEKASHLQALAFPPLGIYKNEFCQMCNTPVTTTDQQIDACNVTNHRQETYKDACLYLPDVSYHPMVHPHRNVFCSLCNSQTESSVINKSSLQSCIPLFGEKYPVASHLMRNLFAPIVTLNADTFKAIPREATFRCYPGRVMTDGVCTPIIKFPVNMEYSIHVLCHLKISALTNDTSYIFSEVRESVVQLLVNSYANTSGRITAFFFLPEQPFFMVQKEGAFLYELQVTLSYVLLYLNRFDRDSVEKELIRTPQNIRMIHSINGSDEISFSFEGIGFSNVSNLLLQVSSHTENSDYSRFQNHFSHVFYSRPGMTTIVNELLVCVHQFYRHTDVDIDDANLRFVVKETKEIFYIGDFIIDYKDQFRVCAKLPRVESPSLPLAETLSILTTVLNIMSIIFLLSLFALYLLIPYLRTVPGLNVMSTTFSLFCMQVTYTVNNEIPIGTLPCKIVGVLLHYFWLSLCSCMFICCFHMYNSFRPLSRIRNSRKQFLRYQIFSYGLPFIMVFLNVFLSWFVNGNIGYGTRLCFVEGVIQNITTFIIPLILTCVGNIALFIPTIVNIKFDKSIQKSKENKHELVIFCKLFCLTGSVWILQVIDSFLHLSFFSFVATIFTSSQGLFIFLSFATSSRVIKKLKTITSQDSKENGFA